ncbi:hypothetical protein GYMLUDRAFT_45965 [Collybiopsis luxurians FD-317 M1]|uniref:Uncharacterized protein n=1 Tax=Collybiopsis luxurians FD-317 M1 TaxID=944289 RepID=A0A0D0CHN6_9AGAR|nr:hypothetical protein GYMLUDRAFT_45965 [Collybiopsis luxurians FD-317 M1]
MATFSPSPAPRRSARIPRNNVQPTSPPRRLRVPNTNSRLSTPNRNTDAGSVASMMDIDDRGSSVGSERSHIKSGIEHVFAKSDQLTVSFYANLPLEVSQILRNADFYRDAYSGEIDTLTGFALVASMKTCFVWQHALAVKGIPTCYIFTCPYDYNQTNPPFHSLVPWGSGREPGLILISTAGEVRFWDSVGIGLAGGDRYSTIHLGLASEDIVTGLKRIDTQIYVVSTASGSLFKLILTSTGGKYHLTSHPFSKPSTSLSLSRLIPFFSSSSTVTTQIVFEPGNISSVALGAQTVEGGREIWVLINSRVQRWEMKLEGWEEALQDHDIAELVRTAIRKTFGDAVEKDDARLDLELVDLAVDNANKLIILVSYAGLEEVDMMAMDMTGIRRIYTLVQLSPSGDSFKVDAVRGVPYQSTSSSGAPMHPRIQILPDGLLVSIQFGDAVALCARGSDYQERLELKSATDRTLGVGVMQQDSVVLVLTAATMMKVNIDVDSVLTFDPESGRANLIKSIMTQAILYGSLPNNPLHFSFPPDVDEESLMQAAEQLSLAILQSDPELVRGNQDLSSQLRIRKERLAWLIQFINENTALIKMSQRCRQRLATDAEKLEAAYELWVIHNELLATGPTHSVLNDAVFAHMNEFGDTSHEDFMRAFFKSHVNNLGILIEKIPDITLNAAQQTGRNIGDLLPEANRILLTVLTAAFRHREQNIITYGIDLPMINAWTSTSFIADGITALFETTTRVAAPGAESYNQLPELAEVLFACISQRLEGLAINAGAEASGVERDLHGLRTKFDVLRPEVLETLRKSGHPQAAFSLAEKYQDFSSLAALCHRETIYPPVDNPNFARIQGYIERFKEQFTTKLYEWYIQHGEVRTLFAQGESYSAYMDSFFEKNPATSISWIHDLGKKRYEAAAKALLVESQHAASLEVKHLQLSIGKLANLAHMRKSDGTAENSLHDAFHDALDLVGVHEALIDEFNGVIANIRGRRSLDSQVDTIVKEKASGLAEKPEHTLIFKNLVKDLLQGKVLSIEDTVDVLTLKDNLDTVGDYATALHLLSRCNLPETRKHSAFRTVWRRIYLHDDWKAIQKTVGVGDAELSQRFRETALYFTLLDILSRENQDEPEGYETDPDVALIVPSLEEIASRWPGIPQDQVERVQEDYNLECDRLGELDLEEAYPRVRELAEMELMQGSE